MTEAGWKETDSGVFARLGEVFTPGREEIERVILDHVPAGHGEPFLAVDIGCGSGWLSEAILREYPNSRLLALDGSEEMLRRTGERLASFGPRAETRAFRLEDPAWISRIEVPVRCFVSSLVIHHLDGAGKRELFRRLFEKLEPGGALLYADVVEEKSEQGRKYMACAWDEEVWRRSREITGDDRAYRLFVDEGWNMYEHPDPMDKPSGVAEQLRWLEEAGYTGVDVPWARAGHAVFCGCRQ
ncbi:MAG: class I SAM-dependent methyltransferase [Rubrobacteraceae bacterium]